MQCTEPTDAPTRQLRRYRPSIGMQFPYLKRQTQVLVRLYFLFGSANQRQPEITNPFSLIRSECRSEGSYGLLICLTQRGCPPKEWLPIPNCRLISEPFSSLTDGSDAQRTARSRFPRSWPGPAKITRAMNRETIQRLRWMRG